MIAANMDGSCEQIVCLLELVETCPSHYSLCGFWWFSLQVFQLLYNLPKPPFSPKVIVFQAKRERQEYPSIDTASTNVWKFNKIWRFYEKDMNALEYSRTFYYFPSQKTVFLKKIKN